MNKSTAARVIPILIAVATAAALAGAYFAGWWTFEGVVQFVVGTFIIALMIYALVYIAPGALMMVVYFALAFAVIAVIGFFIALFRVFPVIASSVAATLVVSGIFGTVWIAGPKRAKEIGLEVLYLLGVIGIVILLFGLFAGLRMLLSE